MKEIQLGASSDCALIALTCSLSCPVTMERFLVKSDGAASEKTALLDGASEAAESVQLPSTVTGTSENGSAVPMMITADDNPITAQTDLFLANLLADVKPYGGVRQYLQSHLNTQMAQCAFAKYIQEQLPDNSPTAQCEGPWPAYPPDCDAPVFKLDIWKFAFSNDGSLREPPTLQMSVSLWQRIVAEGFLTKQEPLMVHMENPSSDEKLANFSVGHTKSQGRTLTLLAFLWYCYKHTVQLQEFATRQQCVVYFAL